MYRWPAVLVEIVAASVLSSYPEILLAHHGAAAYERETTVTFEATIVGFEWENPHALIRFESGTAAGLVDVWVAETAGLVILSRAGWDRDTLKPGDRCTVIGHPAKNGSRTMILERVTWADGRELGNFIP